MIKSNSLNDTVVKPGLDSDPECDKVTRSRTIKANVEFDGLNYKMRLRKEESVFKVIDFVLDFSDINSDDKSETDISARLTDF